jgi:hypothetical protein
VRCFLTPRSAALGDRRRAVGLFPSDMVLQGATKPPVRPDAPGANRSVTWFTDCQPSRAKPPRSSQSRSELPRQPRASGAAALDLEAVTALADHGCFLRWTCPYCDQKNDQGMTAPQAKQSTQAADLGSWVGLAGLEPATERL